MLNYTEVDVLVLSSATHPGKVLCEDSVSTRK